MPQEVEQKEIQAQIVEAHQITIQHESDDETNKDEQTIMKK